MNALRGWETVACPRGESSGTVVTTLVTMSTQEHGDDDGCAGMPARSEELRQQLRDLLMGWDPIGVAGVPQAADEYDCMLDPILGRLRAGADSKTLAAWLRTQVGEHFGLQADAEREQLFAQRAIAWWAVRSGEGRER